MSSVVERYFEMWNTGDTTAIAELITEDWLDHAHPEVVGPGGVQLVDGRMAEMWTYRDSTS